QNGKIEVLQLPRPHRQCNQRKKKTQAQTKTKAKPQRLSAISLPDKAIPSLARVLEWASNTNDMDHLNEMLANYPVIMTDAFLAARSPRAKRVSVHPDDYDYNFVISKNLVIKLDAVVKAEKAKRRTPASFGGNAEDEYPVGTVEEIVAFFPGGLPKFTRFVVGIVLRRCCLLWRSQCYILVVLSMVLYHTDAVYGVCVCVVEPSTK
ncbi:hypothetical protein PHYSODRAFT_483809, partial [Phytophthora sojae]